MNCGCSRIFLPSEERILHGMECKCVCEFCSTEREYYKGYDMVEWNRKGFGLPELHDLKNLRGAFRFLAKVDNCIDGIFDRKYHIKTHIQHGYCANGYPLNTCPVMFPGVLEKWENGSHV